VSTHVAGIALVMKEHEARHQQFYTAVTRRISAAKMVGLRAPKWLSSTPTRYGKPSCK
jgi:hypothetical protein